MFLHTTETECIKYLFFFHLVSFLFQQEIMWWNVLVCVCAHVTWIRSYFVVGWNSPQLCISIWTRAYAYVYAHHCHHCFFFCFFLLRMMMMMIKLHNVSRRFLFSMWSAQRRFAHTCICTNFNKIIKLGSFIKKLSNAE